jgi:DNA-nicking Smr family endonuclease
MARRKKKRRGGRPPVFGFSGDLLDATPVATLDLHGDTALEAQRRVRDFVETQARISRGKVVHIITGRGARGKAVLPGAVRQVLSGESSRFIDEFDKDLDEAGYLIRLR